MRKNLILAVLMMLVSLPTLVFANGGPFVVKYPKGDPAAKGVLARIGDDLMPGRLTDLKVVKEELKIDFTKLSHRRNPRPAKDAFKIPPLVSVSAEYTINNPTKEEVIVDFGFPILRGIYVPPMSMMPKPQVNVKLGDKNIPATIISNSAIYGIIRQKARAVIAKGVADDKELSALVKSARKSKGRQEVIGEIIDHLVNDRKWNKSDAVLLSEYATLTIDKLKSNPRDIRHFWFGQPADLHKLTYGNIGPLSAIGEQKATQFFAQLATCFDKDAGAAYEKIFTAWGGDVRERSIDMTSGKIRPRKLDIKKKDEATLATLGFIDPTIYARVSYFDEKAKITGDEKRACKSILKNLPVIFTFAPMNILYYQAKFKPDETVKLTVSYNQHAYADSEGRGSYQLAYVVHPASLWDNFGPINLTVTVPTGVPFKASVPCVTAMTQTVSNLANAKNNVVYTGTVEDKIGELFVAVDAMSWDKPNHKKVANQMTGLKLR